MHTNCYIFTNWGNSVIEEKVSWVVIQMSLKCNKTVMVKYHNILYNKKTKKGTEENEKPWKPWYTIYIYTVSYTHLDVYKRQVYTHEALKPILNVTYGCMVYQEQVMQIVRDLAGYSLGRADLVRRAMGKKKLDVMAKEREIFIHGQVDEQGNVVVPGCVRNGIDEQSANTIFDEMAEFAKYAFNKSHAAAYAVVSYRTAYLKAYYPAEFMAATLNSFLGNLDKIPVSYTHLALLL